jgi:hypothetical protein
MPKWQELANSHQTRLLFTDIWNNMYNWNPKLGRHAYARNLLIAVQVAIHCGYSKIVAVEFGVGKGGGLLELCTAAQFFRDRVGMEIFVAGFDTGKGLPPPEDYRDHPEMWNEGGYAMDDPAALRAKLPDFARLILGDIGDTAPQYLKELDGARVGFVSIDVDYYSSTKKAFRFLTDTPETYLPVVPMYMDDAFGPLMLNPWCGEQLAIAEFNEENRFRKIAPNAAYRIPPVDRIYALHVLDHPLRTGQQKPRYGWELDLRPFDY